jgi:hypothetical protein
LSVNIEGGSWVLTLNVPSQDRAEAVTLGVVKDPSTVQTWSKGRLNDVFMATASGLAVTDRLRTIGTELARRVMSPDGHNLLASYYGQVDTVILATNQTDIPWELMCPPPDAGDLLPLMCQQWRVLRWPANPLMGALCYQVADPRGMLGRLLSIGLPVAPDTPWRIAAPNDLQELRSVIARCDTLHLVGHWENGALHIAGTSMTLDAEMVRAYGLAGPKSVFLSSCATGAEVLDANMALAFTVNQHAKRVVWSPLVTILESAAEEVDLMLATYQENEELLVEEIVRKEMSSNPLLNLYVRYGLSRP